MSKEHIGSSIDDFIKEGGIFDEAQAQAIKEVVVPPSVQKRDISSQWGSGRLLPETFACIILEKSVYYNRKSTMRICLDPCE